MHKILDTLKLTLLHVGYADLDNRWQFDNVISPFNRLYLITDGEAWVYHQNQKFVLKPGFLYLIPSFSYCKYHCDTQMSQYYISFLDNIEGGMGIYDLLNFDYEVKARPIDFKLFERILLLNPDRHILKSDPKTYDNKPDLLSYNVKYGQVYDKYMETQGILTQLFSRFFKMEKLAENSNSKPFRRLASIIPYIDENLSEKLTVEELAGLVHLHPDYFSRLFLTIHGVRPIEFINNKRMERAQFLLITTELTISEIAMKVGILNFSYFTRLFKKRFNRTPAAYRKQSWHI